MKILYLSPINLKEPKRGTPIRIVNLLRQINKRHELFISCTDVDEEFKNVHVPYPQLGILQKLKIFLSVIREKQIQLIMTSGEACIKLPILLKLISGVKIVNDLHGVPGEEEFLAGFVGINKKRWIQFKIKFFLRFYDHLFPVSGKLKNYFLKVNRNATTIHGGVNLYDFPPRDATVKNDIFTIGYTGNFRSYQGLDLLFEAAKIIKDRHAFNFKLRLIINGDQDKIKQRLIEMNLLSDTDLFTNLPHQQAGQLIASSDVLIVPRPSIPVTELAFPSKLPEFIATAAPVITTNVGPVEEIFANKNICCIITSTNNIAHELSNAIQRVQSMSQDERDRLGKAGRDFVESHLTWDIIGVTINNALEKI